MTLAVLLAVMLLTTAGSICFGAIDFSAHDMVAAVSHTLSGAGDLTLNQRIFMQLRVPRVILCLLVGACLGIGGTLMRALSQPDSGTWPSRHFQRSRIWGRDVLCIR